MEGVASIHGDIHEAAQSELWGKASFVSTNELSAYLEFLWKPYALSDFWLSYVQQRLCWTWGMKFCFLQTLNRNYQEAFFELSKVWEEPRNNYLSNAPVCTIYMHWNSCLRWARRGGVKPAYTLRRFLLIYVVHALITRLSSGGIFCHQIQLFQVPRTTGGAWMLMSNAVNVWRHSIRYCLATAVLHV